MNAAELAAKVRTRTVPTPPAPESNGNRLGRPFTLRIEPAQEDTLRRELARLELLPGNDRPAELFGYNDGRRRASFGWFVLWSALEHARAAPSGWPDRPTKKPGKTTGARRGAPGKTRKGGRRRAGKKGGRK